MQPHLAIFHVNSVSDATFTEFRSTLANENINVIVVSREPDGPFAGMEWLMPTVVVGFVASAYFGGFFQEMGKDHYNLLKEQLKKLYSPLAGPEAPEIRLIGTAGKVKAEQPYSLYFSIVGEGPDETKFKLLLRRPISDQDYAASIDAFLDFLQGINRGEQNPELIQRFKLSNQIGKTVLLVVSQKTGKISPINPRTGEIID